MLIGVSGESSEGEWNSTTFFTRKPKKRSYKAGRSQPRVSFELKGVGTSSITIKKQRKFVEPFICARNTYNSRMEDPTKSKYVKVSIIAREFS